MSESSKTAKPGSLLSPVSQVSLIGCCILFLLFGLIQLAEFLPHILAMLSGALILCYLLLGPVMALEHAWAVSLPGKLRGAYGLQKILAILVVYLFMLGLVVLSAFRIALPLSVQVKEFAREIPGYLSTMRAEQNASSQFIQTFRQTVIRAAPPQAGEAPSKVVSQSHGQTFSRIKIFNSALNILTRKMMRIVQAYATKLGGYLLNIGGATVSGLVYILTTLVLVFYLLHDGPILQKGLVNLLPDRLESEAMVFLNRLHQHFYILVGGQAIMAILGGTLMYILLLCLGVKYALLLGVLYGAAAILPVIGPWLGLVPIAALLEIQGSPIIILPVASVVGLFYLLKTYWLWPQLISDEVHMHPLLFLLTFLGCMHVLGFAGLLVSFPLASLLGVLLDYQKKKQAVPSPV